MIDLEGLVSLRAVAERGSVVAAAELVGYTPSAVSQQVKRLERQLGVVLLERVGRGVVLTPAGVRVVEDGARVLGAVEDLESGVRAGEGAVAGRLRLAAFSTAVPGLVVPALAALRHAHPDLAVHLREEEPWRTLDLVGGGHVEVGLVHSWGDVALDVPAHLVTTVVAHDRADLVVAADHPLAGREQVSPADLLGARWVATGEGTICRQWLARMHHGTGSPPRIEHVAADFSSHLAMAAAGLAVALVPRLGRGPLPPGAVAVPVRDPVPTREVAVVHRASMDGSPSVVAVVAAVRAVAG